MCYINLVKLENYLSIQEKINLLSSCLQLKKDNHFIPFNVCKFQISMNVLTHHCVKMKDNVRTCLGLTDATVQRVTQGTTVN